MADRPLDNADCVNRAVAEVLIDSFKKKGCFVLHIKGTLRDALDNQRSAQFLRRERQAWPKNAFGLCPLREPLARNNRPVEEHFAKSPPMPFIDGTRELLEMLVKAFHG